MPKILMIVFSDIKNDPRVYRHICFLKDRYDITAVGYENPDIDGVEFIHVKMNTERQLEKIKRAILLKLGRFEEYYWTKYDFSEVFNKLNNKKFDLIIANDVNTLPLALKLHLNRQQKLYLLYLMMIFGITKTMLISMLTSFQLRKIKKSI